MKFKNIILFVSVFFCFFCSSVMAQTAEEWNKKGIELYKEGYGKLGEAMKCFEKALALDPKAPELWINKGNVYLLYENYGESIKCYNKALEYRPDYIKALLYKSVALNKKSELEKSKACIDKILKINPELKGFKVKENLMTCGTPLHVAAMLGHKKFASLLISKGADVNAKNDMYETPLHVAIEYGQKESTGGKEIIEFLVSKGAQLNARLAGGITPLHLYCFYPDRSGQIYFNKDVMELFIKKGTVNINVRDDTGETPLHYACKGKAYGEVIELLISSGADVNVKNDMGETPLFRLIETRNCKSLELLISLGADVNIRNNEGITPLNKAEEYGYSETVDILKKYGAE